LIAPKATTCFVICNVYSALVCTMHVQLSNALITIKTFAFQAAFDHPRTLVPRWSLYRVWSNFQLWIYQLLQFART